ncbi:MAG: peptidoglycan-binding protein [Gammaproteobacteria bacterium]|nr:peptidoglycan-binding protein [Gammaproteobacteria bacterium]MCP5135870.1 peptidoglycan-binding protein [Gammaproteobacteria bacterium]
MVREAQRVWKTDIGKNAAPASDELLAAAAKHGINLDAAKPGMCFHEHYHPAEYTTETKQVLVSDADAALAVNEAKYRWVEKRVMVKEPSFRMEEVPAQYEWVEEKVVDEPAHTIWKKGEGPIQKIDEATGEIMCLVEVPATYKTLRKRVEKSAATTRRIEIPAEYETVKVRELVADASESKREIPATYKTVEITKKISDNEFLWHEVHDMSESRQTRTGNKICLTEIPAEYKTVTRKVVKTPATTRKVEIPAETKTMKVRKMMSEPQEKRIAIPAEYKTITERQLEKEGFMEWRSILCKTNMTDARITQIQEALARAGYNPGPIDGVVGAETIAAVNAFQKAKGLPVDRYLNIQTLDALGVAAK